MGSSLDSFMTKVDEVIDNTDWIYDVELVDELDNDKVNAYLKICCDKIDEFERNAISFDKKKVYYRIMNEIDFNDLEFIDQGNVDIAYFDPEYKRLTSDCLGSINKSNLICVCPNFYIFGHPYVMQEWAESSTYGFHGFAFEDREDGRYFDFVSIELLPDSEEVVIEYHFEVWCGTVADIDEWLRCCDSHLKFRDKLRCIADCGLLRRSIKHGGGE